MKIAIIGSGLGGLLSGAKLAQSGHKVEIFEKLEVAGGRFINLDYKGHTLSSGALHMIPHGEDGPLGQMLKELNADVNIVNSDPSATIAVKKDDDIEIISFHNARQLLSFRSKIKIALFGLLFKVRPPSSMSFKEWSDRHVPDELFAKTSVAFCGWALSLPPEEVSASEMKAISENINRYGGPGVPIGGCSAVIDALIHIIEGNGGVIHIGTGIQNIETRKEKGDDGRVQTYVSGVCTDTGDVVDADIIISNIGHPETVKLADSDTISDLDGAYMQKVTSSRPSAGIKICISSDEPLVGHSNILMTPYARRINGMNEVTQIDPSLAPAGKHLIVTHQTMLSDDYEQEIKLGLADVDELFKGKDYEILLIQSHRDNWPVNRASSGTGLGNRTPIDGLYVVGDGAKGKGGIEVEGVALGVMNTMKIIEQLK